MLGLKLIHVSQRGPLYLALVKSNQSTYIDQKAVTTNNLKDTIN